MPGTSTVTILFTDVVGSTALTQRLGDAKAQEVLIGTHNIIVRETLKLHSGLEIKHTGDGIMASFSSATSALKCAIAMQEAFALHNETSEERIGVRIGLNAGEPITEEEDLFGTAVQLAARICDQAEPGQILVSNVTRELTAGKGFVFADRRETDLKGFQDPVAIYSVVWRQGKLSTPSTPQTPTAKQTTSSSIAVLPFTNMSADPEQEYFCDGISEELITALTKLKDLRVIARTSAFSFKGKNVNVRDVGKELGVETVLEGSVRKAGNHLRITAQLVDTKGGHHLWSDRYDREMDDIFAIQDEVTLAIVDNLRIRLVADEKQKFAKRQTVSIEAYNLYLKARWFSRTGSREGLNKAIEYFERVLESAPDYAPAYAGLSESYSALPIYGFAQSHEAYPKAKAAAEKALQIDGLHAGAQIQLAYIKMMYDWDWAEAKSEFERAIKLHPGYADAHHRYALYLMYREQFDEAVNEINLALELDPLSLTINRNVGVILNFARRYEQAIKALQNTLEMDPNFSRAHFELGRAYLGMSMYEEALAAYEKEKNAAKSWDAFADTFIGITYVKMGRRDDARRILDDLIEQSKERYLPPWYLAQLCFVLGEDDQGFKYLDESYEERGIMGCIIKIHPQLDSVRSDSRYLAMLEKVGLDK
jgi:TolB-like protein/Flp pilus assembly protein TadD